MNEINSTEKIFLGKLTLILRKFDELDVLTNEVKEMIENQPEKQRRLDQLLSDYYHILEKEDVTDTEIINVGRKIHEARISRRDENNTSILINCYEKNKQKLQYSTKGNRELFRQAINLTMKRLNENYEYRVLTNDDLKQLSKNDKNKDVVQVKKRRPRRKGITKEQIEECVKKGMKNKDIAKKYDVADSYISLLKKKYGFSKKVKK